MEGRSKGLTDHSGQGDPADVVNELIEGPPDGSAGSYGFTSLSAGQYAESAVDDNESHGQHQEWQ